MVEKILREKLNRPGSRMSGQRALIFGIIRSAEGHLDADEIYRLARKKSPRISLSTVYRTLNKFKDLGLVDEMHFGQEHHHYESRQPGEHYHMVCQHCRQIIEFEFPLTKQIKESVPQARDFEIMNVEVNMQGLCKKCKNDRRKE
jgi:Fur family transcriptional regulator, ferric uptake regulator